MAVDIVMATCGALPHDAAVGYQHGVIMMTKLASEVMMVSLASQILGAALTAGGCRCGHHYGSPASGRAA